MNPEPPNRIPPVLPRRSILHRDLGELLASTPFDKLQDCLTPVEPPFPSLHNDFSLPGDAMTEVK